MVLFPGTCPEEIATESQTIYSPIPGDTSTFQGFAPGVSFSNADARYNWTVTKMVPKWKDWRVTHVTIDPPTLLKGGYSQ